MYLRDFIVSSTSNKIYELLERCAVRRDYIYIDHSLRGIGKTTALVRLAKKYDLYIVTSNKAQCRYLKSVFDFDDSICQSELMSLRGKKDVFLIFDEGVDPSELSGFEVITGFVY